MLTRFNYFWRLLGTGFSFMMFGLGGLFVAGVVVPVLRCIPGDDVYRSKKTQHFYYHTFRGYIRMMRLLGILTFEVGNIERLRNARLVLANHPTLLDVVFLISLLPNANCVIKGPLMDTTYCCRACSVSSGRNSCSPYFSVALPPA